MIAAARDALGPEARLRVDYNQAYTADEAVRAIEAISPFGIDCAEQPVRADDWLGMARVQRRVAVPLMAHEGCFSLTDVDGADRAGRRRRARRQHRATRRDHPGAARDRLRVAARARHRPPQPAARDRLGCAGADRRGARVGARSRDGALRPRDAGRRPDRRSTRLQRRNCGGSYSKWIYDIPHMDRYR